MKITSIEKTTTTMHVRKITIEDGPKLPAGPAFRDDIEFVADTVEIKWEEGTAVNTIKVTGFRFRNGEFHKSYRHQKVYKTSFSPLPAWLAEIVETQAIDTLR